MGRTTVYNEGLTSEKEWQEVNDKNKKLLKEFVRYCVANDKSPKTCEQYEAQLKIFFCWNLRENDNKFFIDVKKRELVNFFGWGREVGWSPCRLASLRAVLSSFSNFIERILDEDYPTFRNIVKVLEPIALDHVREKTVMGEADVMAMPVGSSFSSNSIFNALMPATLAVGNCRYALPASNVPDSESV